MRIRTIKGEFCTSEQVAKCSHSARLLFILTWPFCDDHGVHPDSAFRLKTEVFPADPCSVADVQVWLEELVNAGLIRRFEVDGERYLIVTGWAKHQRIDRPTYKFPLPADASASDPSILAEDSPTTRRGLDEGSTSDGRACEVASPIATGTIGDNLSRTPRPLDEASATEWSGREMDKDSSTKSLSSATAGTADAEAAIFMEFPTVGKGPKLYGLPTAKLAEYRESFPGIDVEAQLRAARQWCRDNPAKRKTAHGMPAFLTSWLSREQNNASKNSKANDGGGVKTRGGVSDEVLNGVGGTSNACC